MDSKLSMHMFMGFYPLPYLLYCWIILWNSISTICHIYTPSILKIDTNLDNLGIIYIMDRIESEACHVQE